MEIDVDPGHDADSGGSIKLKDAEAERTAELRESSWHCSSKSDED